MKLAMSVTRSGFARADERVDVGVVGERVLADERRLAMARRLRRGQPEDHGRERESSPETFDN